MAQMFRLALCRLDLAAAFRDTPVSTQELTHIMTLSWMGFVF